MKRTIFIVTLFALVTFHCFSQDVLQNKKIILSPDSMSYLIADTIENQYFLNIIVGDDAIIPFCDAAGQILIDLKDKETAIKLFKDMLNWLSFHEIGCWYWLENNEKTLVFYKIKEDEIGCFYTYKRDHSWTPVRTDDIQNLVDKKMQNQYQDYDKEGYIALSFISRLITSLSMSITLID